MSVPDEYGLSAIASTLYDDLIAQGKCVIWAGAGLSEGIYPSWPKAIEELSRECRGDDTNHVESTTKVLIKAAEECKDTNPEVYKCTLARLFSEDKPLGRDEYHFLAATEYLSFVTTNFDPLFEEACKLKSIPPRYYPVLPIGQIGAKECFYIHGAAKQNSVVSGENLIFAESDFKKAYNKTRGRTYKFVTELISFYDILFVGCEIDDPYVKMCFDEMKKIHNNIIKNTSSFKRPTRKILLRDRIETGMDEDERQQEELRKKDEESRLELLDIEIIRFPTIKGKDNYYALKKVLKMIQQISNRRPTAAPTWMEESSDE